MEDVVKLVGYVVNNDNEVVPCYTMQSEKESTEVYWDDSPHGVLCYTGFEGFKLVDVHNTPREEWAINQLTAGVNVGYIFTEVGVIYIDDVDNFSAVLMPYGPGAARSCSTIAYEVPIDDIYEECEEIAEVMGYI